MKNPVENFPISLSPNSLYCPEFTNNDTCSLDFKHGYRGTNIYSTKVERNKLFTLNTTEQSLLFDAIKNTDGK